MNLLKETAQVLVLNWVLKNYETLVLPLFRSWRFRTRIESGVTARDVSYNYDTNFRRSEIEAAINCWYLSPSSSCSHWPTATRAPLLAVIVGAHISPVSRLVIPIQIIGWSIIPRCGLPTIKSRYIDFSAIRDIQSAQGNHSLPKRNHSHNIGPNLLI